MSEENKFYVGWVERAQRNRCGSADDARYDFVGEGRPHREMMRVRFRMLRDETRPDYVAPEEFAAHVIDSEPFPLEAELELFGPDWTHGMISYVLVDGTTFSGLGGEIVQIPLDPAKDLPEVLRPQVPRLTVHLGPDRER